MSAAFTLVYLFITVVKNKVDKNYYNGIIYHNSHHNCEHNTKLTLLVLSYIECLLVDLLY